MIDSAPARDDWRQYEEQGYLKLGRLLDGAQVQALRRRIDAIMQGTAPVPYERMLMQLDPNYGEPSSTRGFKGATLHYRKIQDLEHDELFRTYLERPLFRAICSRVYGDDIAIAAYRAMFMNKPAGSPGTIGWHQDRWINLDRDPLVTVWTALDPATSANGCVQVIPGSHRCGLINPSHHAGYITDEQATQYAPEAEVVNLELQAGEAVLLHNWLLHRSGANTATIARRAFSVCYMDARTRAANGESFTTIWAA